MGRTTQHSLWIFFAVLCVATLPSATAEITYTINLTRSEFVVQLFKASVGSALAHDRVVRATTYAGHIRFAPSTPRSRSVTIAESALNVRVGISYR